ncbi:transmembrane protein, putative (macronuclear) [Tetrahymena thermophila SB210]|uniref:Transmembrane protein, putative n=1 Tax=Tetrahymena thermophila (strain SB210) TaxID=312017 RepID=Q23CT8_TETTS|nr:transmembrane protein, putative [Tetrahymena thermophila SB210]EAR94454.1 transmembrane protein, putative [Tetrahymena thermophila SB210]|eukprot:XP_001014948.1 transmembrane protein, putative [Tetrahymena thermophila SB210]
MSSNEPGPEIQKILKVVESQAGQVPQNEVLQQPKSQQAKNLLEQLEYFKFQFTLKFRHIAWMGLATYLCYDRYRAYQQYREEKQQIFGQNRKLLQEKYGKINQKYTQSTIHPRGDPDQGDWVYFEELPDEDQKLFLQRKLSYQNKAAHFNSFMPLYITSGLCFPISAFFLGAVFKKKIFDDQFSINSRNKNQLQANQQDKVTQQNNNQPPEQNNISNIPKLQEKKQNFLDVFIQTKLPNNVIYGLVGGFSLASSIKILQFFM